MELNFIVN